MELSRARIGQLTEELAGLDKVVPKLVAVNDATREQIQLQNELAGEIPITYGAYDDLITELPGLYIEMGKPLEGLLDVLPGIAPEMRQQAGRVATGVNEGFLSKLSQIDIAGTFSRAFQGGGGFMGAVKSLASQVASVFTDALGGWLNKALGGVLGRAIKGALGSGGGGGGKGAVVSKAFSSAGSVASSSFMGGLFGGGAAAGGASAAASASITTASGATFGGLSASAGGAGGGLFGGVSSGFATVAAAIPVWGWAALGASGGRCIHLTRRSKEAEHKLEKAGRQAAAEARTAIAETLDGWAGGRSCWQYGRMRCTSPCGTPCSVRARASRRLRPPPRYS